MIQWIGNIKYYTIGRNGIPCGFYRNLADLHRAMRLYGWQP